MARLCASRLDVDIPEPDTVRCRHGEGHAGEHQSGELYPIFWSWTDDGDSWWGWADR